MFERAFSFSRIEKYLKCSFWYYLRHVMKRVVPTDSVPTAAGTIIHTTFEEFYGPVIDRSMSVVEVLEVVWMNKLQSLGLLHLTDKLESIAQDVAQLHVRAAAGYGGIDAIRDDKGKVYTKPAATNAWKTAHAALRLPERQREIDNLAKNACSQPGAKETVFATVSLSMVFALTFTFANAYKVDQITEAGLTVLAQELIISLPPAGSPKGTPIINPVRLPNGVLYSGKIDMICSDQYGRIYLIDHKTSKKEPMRAEVSHWEQLLLYAYAHFSLYGRWPDFIGINSVLHNKLIIMPFDQKLVPAALERAMQAINGIDKEVWIQQAPTAYSSNCYNSFNSEMTCEFIHDCHPDFALAVGLRK